MCNVWTCMDEETKGDIIIIMTDTRRPHCTRGGAEVVENLKPRLDWKVLNFYVWLLNNCDVCSMIIIVLCLHLVTRLIRMTNLVLPPLLVLHSPLSLKCR